MFCTGSFDFRAKTLSVCIGFDIPKCNLTIGENFYGSLESNGFHTKKFLRMKWFALRSAEVRCFFQIRIYIFRWRSSCWSPEKVLRSSVCVPLLLWNKSIKLYDTFPAQRRSYTKDKKVSEDETQVYIRATQFSINLMLTIFWPH